MLLVSDRDQTYYTQYDDLTHSASGNTIFEPDIKGSGYKGGGGGSGDAEEQKSETAKDDAPKESGKEQRNMTRLRPCRS